MFKHLLNHASPTALMLFDADSDNRAALREQLAKGVNVTAKSENEPEPKKEDVVEAKDDEGDDENDDDENEDENEDDADDEDNEPELDADGKPVVKEETAEEKAAKEAKERAEFKEKRKNERIQKRIDNAIAAKERAEAENIALKAQLAADPDKKLTEEEVNRRAKELADTEIKIAEEKRVLAEFNKACDKIQDEGEKLDPNFTKKTLAMAEELGPIPSRVIGILSEFDNGAEVLKFLVDDIDEAQNIYDLQNRPEKLGIALARISDKLIEAKKPKAKVISKVPDPVTPVKGRNVQSTQITSNDTKPENMESYIRKRTAQREQQRKERGY